MRIRRHPDSCCGTPAFTLIELLVVVAIIAVLLSLLLPAMRTARISARIVRAHAELRHIELALQMYADTNEGRLPPTRFSCNLRSGDELPVELSRQRFLPYQDKLVRDSHTGGGFFIGAVQMGDVFNPSETYKYRAVGPAILNETTLMLPPNGARLWVPDDFPDCAGEGGRYYRDPKESPVRYAVWSVGPDPNSPKFINVPGQMPVPRRFWCQRATDTGIITHFQGRDGRAYVSP
jgi:prepilin-type N-terminal cleavage/methylation domain-containing protein